MDSINRFIIVFSIFLISSSCFSQNENLSTKSNKAINYYNQALDEFNTYNYNLAIEKLSDAIKKDTLFIESYLLKAQIYNTLKDNNGEIENYTKAFQINSECYLPGYYFLAVAQLNSGQYFNAKKNFNRYINYKLSDVNNINRAKKYIDHCDFAIEAILNPVPFTPINLGDSINSKLDEYWPSLSADESYMVFTRLIPRNPSVTNSVVSFKTHHEDLYLSYKPNTTWRKAKSMGSNINSAGNEGTQSLSVDGKYYFFTACNRKDSYGGCDIYYVEKKGDNWLKPINVGSPVNSKFKESQPAISSDGQTLFFVSNRPGGKGNLDIWKCIMSDEGYWQKPINLGDSINTPDEEASPFLHPDGETFYFASKGHLGMGGMDIFISRIKNNSFSTPVNIGYPINTNNDEQGIHISTSGKFAYFSSNRSEENGKDIFMFEIYEELKPLPVTYVKGYIADSKTKKRLLAKIELIDLITKETKANIVSDEINGTYLVCLPTGKDYALNISKRGYLFHSENFSLKNLNYTIKPFLLNVDLQSIEVGSKAILKNIFFEIDSYDLENKSYIELDKLAIFLISNPQLVIEISGHTDNTGEENYNIQLSEKRAKSVFNYLIANKINSSTILYKGYGSAQPIAENSTKEGRAKNRRTEFKIIRK